MPKAKMKLSVIIPAYNEVERLPTYLDTVLKYIDDEYRGLDVEVIVIDDGSKDKTADVAAEMDKGRGVLRVIRYSQNRGKGHAVKVGMLDANGDLRLFTDADGATPISELPKLLRAIEDGADIAIASRVLPDATRTVSSHLHRKFIGNIFNLIVRFLAVPGIYDTQCGFKLFKGDIAEKIFRCQRLEGFSFDVELLFIALKGRFTIAETPVNWSDVSGSKVNMIADSVRMFFDIISIRCNWLFGRYTDNRK